MNILLHIIITTIGCSLFSGFLCVRFVQMYDVSWFIGIQKWGAIHFWLFLDLSFDLSIIFTTFVILLLFFVGTFAYLLRPNIVMKSVSVLTILLWYLIGITIVFGQVT